MESGKKVSDLNESLEAANISLSENQKELDHLVKENADITKKLAEALDTLDSAKAFSHNTERVLSEALAAKSGSVPVEKYEELREYTKNVVRAYAEQKVVLKKYGEDRRKLAMRLKQVSESQKQNAVKAETARRLKERQEKTAAEKKTVQEQRAVYEAEQKKLRSANPEVVQYFRDAVRMYPELMEHKDRIISKYSVFEAQMAVLAIQHPTGQKMDEHISHFSTPISSRTATTPEPAIRLRKGEL